MEQAIQETGPVPDVASGGIVAPSQVRAALEDVASGLQHWKLWGRLAAQEVRRRYRRTVIGPFWSTLSLGIFILAMGVVWTRLWHQDATRFMPFLCSGLIVWALLSALITEGCTVFFGNEGLIKQLRFPYTMLVCAAVWRNLLLFFHNLIIFVGVAVYCRVPVTPATLLLVPALGMIFINGLWVAIVLGLICARFRDLMQVVLSLLQMAMFVTPIFWTPSQLGESGKHLVEINFLYHYLDIVRSPMLGVAPSPLSWRVVLVGTVLGWAVALTLFSRFRRRLPYWL